ncbi:sodium/potassium-transporting ATPase subunit beta-2 [Asbolus verrucosus]|uniref:Sodium/potassium-transporting ATPase subunit beta-2 n=1 Tax=Asbolus verrucosus TaxID=1661398 RepID=A0A482VZF1_ASBVE|nr:sodium/potassium-transporting ATPase subunit beta-2 [Asbolus verrucosus]
MNTKENIGKTLLFYLIFYAVLLGFFAVMLAVFYQTLDDIKPKRRGNDSLIGSNPGLGFRPMPPDSNVKSTLIWYNSSDKGYTQYWQNELDKFLSAYTDMEKSENIQNCDDIDQPEKDKACEFKLAENFAPCLHDYGYGFDSNLGGPCIFLKLNKVRTFCFLLLKITMTFQIFGWQPEYYNSTTIPSTMPQYLREHIEMEERKDAVLKLLMFFNFESLYCDHLQHYVVWVDCVGENPADVENIGAITYHPLRGFHQKYFPFTNVKGYVSPLVAVHFEKPERGVLINIECKAWARNIHHDRVNRRGLNRGPGQVYDFRINENWAPRFKNFKYGVSTKLLFFYFIFYAVLAAFFAGMMAFFYRSLNDDRPKLLLHESLIGNNPIYTRPATSENIQNCDQLSEPEDGKVCEFQLSTSFAPCLNEYHFGLDSKEGGPCIFLKLNKIFGWVPECYNSTTAPRDMPKHLREYIKLKEMIGEEYDMIWIDCEGENPVDKNNLGPITYYPARGFHQKYFPFTNIKGYVSPLVAVHFEKPKRDTLINVECKAWARNIYHDRFNNRGMVHFKLMIH